MCFFERLHGEPTLIPAVPGPQRRDLSGLKRRILRCRARRFLLASGRPYAGIKRARFKSLLVLNLRKCILSRFYVRAIKFAKAGEACISAV